LRRNCSAIGTMLKELAGKTKGGFTVRNDCELCLLGYGCNEEPSLYLQLSTAIAINVGFPQLSRLGTRKGLSGSCERK